MALFERSAPGDDLRRARRYGGRQLRGLADESDPSRLKEVSAALAQDVDPQRFRSLYRERLRGLPKFGSISERFDPRSKNSAAMRQFGSLYRNFGS